MTDRDTIAELRERVRQLEELLAPTAMAFPLKWELTASEGLVLACLVAGQDGYRTKEQLLHVLASHSKKDEIDPKNVGATIHWLRKKLKPFGIRIETRYGLGFQLEAASLAALRALQRAASDFEVRK